MQLSVWRQSGHICKNLSIKETFRVLAGVKKKKNKKGKKLGGKYRCKKKKNQFKILLGHA